MGRDAGKGSDEGLRGEEGRGWWCRLGRLRGDGGTGGVGIGTDGLGWCCDGLDTDLSLLVKLSTSALYPSSISAPRVSLGAEKLPFLDLERRLGRSGTIVGSCEGIEGEGLYRAEKGGVDWSWGWCEGKEEMKNLSVPFESP